LNHVFGLFDTLLGKLGDVAEAFEIVVEFNKGSEVCEASNFPFHYIAGIMIVYKAIPRIGLEILDRER